MSRQRKRFTDKEWDDAFREHFNYEQSIDTEGNASSKTTKRANEADHYGYNSAEEVISRLEGTDCRGGTSCPDQLARALKEYLNK